MTPVANKLELTLEELAEQCKTGDLHAFESLVQRLESRVTFFLYRMVGNMDDAADLAQDSFVKAYKNIQRYDSKYSFTTWLFTIAKRTAYNYFRSAKPTVEFRDDAELEEAKKKAAKAEEELAEALATVESLRESISEMNLLNSKLLYCNKLFRANALTEAQKVKVIDALDKSTTTGEAKLVFETLQESFAFTGVEKRAIKEGLGRASKPAGVAPKNVITESVDETVSRFQKLANINK